jgi:AcrR family transcriptional regulator
MTQSSRSDRERILDASRAILIERGAGGLSVSAVMERAQISRTAFYRRFNDVTDVVGEMLREVCADLATHSGAWYVDADAVGRPEMIIPNATSSGAAIAPHARLLCAISDAAGSDERLRALWWSELLQPRIDATVSAIERDQRVGAVRPDLDAGRAAFALTLMGERVALELLGRRGATAEEYARVIGPIWEALLFDIDQTEPAARRRNGRDAPNKPPTAFDPDRRL